MSSPTRTGDLTEGPIARTLFFFTLPVLAGNVLQSLNGSVNAIWVGRFLGTAALAATSGANTVLFFLIGSIFGVALAANILVAQATGARDPERTKQVIGTSVLFFFLLSLVVAALGLVFLKPLLGAMAMPPDALPLALDYMGLLFLGVPALFVFTFVMMVMRGAGDSRTPFYFLVLSVLLDIGLNPVFIFGLGPAPRLGIAGSALATLIAQTTSLAGLIAYLYLTRHPLRLKRGEARYLRLNGPVLRALVSKGIPMGLHMIVVSLSMVAMVSLVNRFGSATSAAYGACMQLWNYIQMPAIAVGMAVSSMTAQNVGARRWDRVQRIALTGVGFNIVMTGALVLVVVLFDHHTLALFLDPASSAMQIAIHANMVVAWSYVFFGVGFVLSGVVRATGAVIPPLILMFVSLWLVRFPFALYFMPRWQADAIWISFPLGSLIWMVIVTVYFRYGNWTSAHMLESVAAAAPEPTQAPVSLVANAGSGAGTANAGR